MPTRFERKHLHKKKAVVKQPTEEKTEAEDGEENKPKKKGLFGKKKSKDK